MAKEEVDLNHIGLPGSMTIAEKRGEIKLLVSKLRALKRQPYNVPGLSDEDLIIFGLTCLLAADSSGE